MAQDCDSLADAEKWRRDLLKDITKKISTIHNASLGEHRIREINDEINKMNRQKHFWETRIRELGGDATKGRQYIDVEGKELPGQPGYKYYGAAKDLPGVRELFSEKADEINLRRQKRSRADMYKHITPDYYGYRDDDDGILHGKERLREKELLAAADEEFADRKRQVIDKIKAAQKARSTGAAGETGGILTAEELALIENDSDTEGEEDKISSAIAVMPGAPSLALQSSSVKAVVEPSAATDAGIKAHVVVPTLADMNSVILEQKKKIMLEKLLVE